MNYQIMSRSEAKRASYHITVPTIIVSITDPDRDVVRFCNAPNSNILGICRVSFDDIDRKQSPDDILMSQEDAKKIKAFVERYKGRAEQIIVHCEAGVSRSAGVMAAIKEWLDGDKLSTWNDQRYRPNQHCYRQMIEAIFGRIL